MSEYQPLHARIACSLILAINKQLQIIPKNLKGPAEIYGVVKVPTNANYTLRFPGSHFCSADYIGDTCTLGDRYILLGLAKARYG